MRSAAVVVGAGVAGLATAKALVELGWDVRVLERESSLRAEGAGLTLWPNAVRALRELGLGDVVEGCSHAIEEGATLRPSGEVIAPAPLAWIAERFGPLLSVHRADLLDGLHRACPVPVEFGAAVDCVDGVLRAGSEPIAADLVVGADGIRSVVREKVDPGAAPRSAGYAAWRGIADAGASTPSGVSEALGRGKRFGLVPLPGKRTYWFAVLVGGRSDDDLEAAFAGWHDPIAEVLALTPPERRSYLELRDLAPLARWHRDGAVLVGDAAHAMTPNLGQGAAQSLLDVAALKRELAARTLAPALAAYERVRKRPAERIVRRSRTVGRVAQTSNPLAAGLRNRAAGLLPQALLARQMSSVLR